MKAENKPKYNLKKVYLIIANPLENKVQAMKLKKTIKLLNNPIKTKLKIPIYHRMKIK